MSVPTQARWPHTHTHTHTTSLNLSFTHSLTHTHTHTQIWWLICQFLPWWMTGAGLGTGSSSGKSIAETTKEIDEHYNKGESKCWLYLSACVRTFYVCVCVRACARARVFFSCVLM